MSVKLSPAIDHQPAQPRPAWKVAMSVFAAAAEGMIAFACNDPWHNDVKNGRCEQVGTKLKMKKIPIATYEF